MIVPNFELNIKSIKVLVVVFCFYFFSFADRKKLMRRWSKFVYILRVLKKHCLYSICSFFLFFLLKINFGRNLWVLMIFAGNFEEFWCWAKHNKLIPVPSKCKKIEWKNRMEKFILRNKNSVTNCWNISQETTQNLITQYHFHEKCLLISYDTQNITLLTSSFYEKHLRKIRFCFCSVKYYSVHIFTLRKLKKKKRICK